MPQEGDTVRREMCTYLATVSRLFIPDDGAIVSRQIPRHCGFRGLAGPSLLEIRHSYTQSTCRDWHFRRRALWLHHGQPFDPQVVHSRFHQVKNRQSGKVGERRRCNAADAAHERRNSPYVCSEFQFNLNRLSEALKHCEVDECQQ